MQLSHDNFERVHKEKILVSRLPSVEQIAAMDNEELKRRTEHEETENVVMAALAIAAAVMRPGMIESLYHEERRACADHAYDDDARDRAGAVIRKALTAED